MQVTLDRNLLVSKLLIPVNKFTDKVTLNVTKDYIDCLCHFPNDTKQPPLIFYSRLNVTTDAPSDIKLNIGSIKKLINALNCISDKMIVLTIASNHIAYDSGTSSFKYHLLEDGIIDKPTINLDKITNFQFDFESIIPSANMGEILKASSFNSESNKIYLFLKDNALFGELTDRTYQNLDSISVKITDQIKGATFQEALPMNVDIFRLVSTVKADTFQLNLNTQRGIVLIGIDTPEFILKYITSALVK